MVFDVKECGTKLYGRQKFGQADIILGNQISVKECIPDFLIVANKGRGNRKPLHDLRVCELLVRNAD